MKNPSDVDTILDELRSIMMKKQADYGPLNIALAPGGPMNGLRVRMYDKLARLNNLADKAATPNFESIEDTLIDLANYAIIGLLVQRGQWEGTD
jgi:Nucleotide modification associated domain 1